MVRPSIPRHQLILKLEFDDAAGFHANYLSDLPEGGVRINGSMVVGLRFVLHISLAELVDPVQIQAVVQWSLPEAHPDGPASGIAFIDPSPEARAWLSDVLDTITQPRLRLRPSSRVLLLEPQPFLCEIYGQEVRNWAELRAKEPLDLVALDDVAAWLEEVARAPAALGIIDIDELPITGLDLYWRLRTDARSIELPLIMLGSPDNVEPLSLVSDQLLSCLRKPLRFGLLMKTVRTIARVPVTAVPRPLGTARGD